jgi:Spy/CpxP family protein refolding chaperone
MKHFKSFALVFTLSAVFSFQTLAGGMGKHGDMPMSPGLPSILNMAEELDFTPEQVTKLMVIEKNSKKSMTKIMEEFKKLMSQMQEEIDKDAPDRAKINMIIEKISSNHSAMLLARTDDMLSILSVLTKKQREKMKKAFKTHMKNGSEGPGTMPPGGPKGPMEEFPGKP